MATIIEILEDKIQHLSEYAEKILKYGGKLMHCLEEMESRAKHSEYDRSRSREMDRYYEEGHHTRYY